MRFLIDEQLPPVLARLFVQLGHSADHDTDIGMDSATDREIWRRALETGAVIVTKDDDFNRMGRDTSGPSVVWLRLGNVTKVKLLARMAEILPQIEMALQAGEKIIEVR